MLKLIRVFVTEGIDEVFGRNKMTPLSSADIMDFCTVIIFSKMVFDDIAVFASVYVPNVKKRTDVTKKNETEENERRRI